MKQTNQCVQRRERWGNTNDKVTRNSANYAATPESFITSVTVPSCYPINTSMCGSQFQHYITHLQRKVSWHALFNPATNGLLIPALLQIDDPDITDIKRPHQTNTASMEGIVWQIQLDMIMLAQWLNHTTTQNCRSDHRVGLPRMRYGNKDTGVISVTADITNIFIVRAYVHL